MEGEKAIQIVRGYEGWQRKQLAEGKKGEEGMLSGRVKWETAKVNNVRGD